MSMHNKNELNKLWNDVRESAIEFAAFGLVASSKALDFTANTLKSVEEELKKTAERLAAQKAEREAKPEAKPEE